MAATPRQMSPSYERLAGVSGILVGVLGILYSVAFMILVVAGRAPELRALLSPLFLMVGGLLSIVVQIAVYHRLRETEASFALLALLLGVVGAVGSAIHGGYDLANAINPPASLPADLPSQINPRGLLSFGVSGVALFIVAWLIGRGGRFPKGLQYLGYVSAILLVLVYLGRLIILDPRNPVVAVPAVAVGFLVTPALYIWLGVTLWRGRI